MPQSTKPAVNQVVNEPFRSVLQELRRDRDARLPMVLKVANLNGWTLQALGDVLGITREGVRLKVVAARLDPKAILPDVPLAPRRALAEPKPPKPKLHISGPMADRLREMHAVARWVNGGTPADDPARTVSVELAAMMASLVEQGISIFEIARALGVRHNAVKARLARHGYRKPSPSQANSSYKGTPARHRATQEECKGGHPLSGDNLRITSTTGMRVCRACERRRSSEYNARKRAEAGIDAARPYRRKTT